MEITGPGQLTSQTIKGVGCCARQTLSYAVLKHAKNWKDSQWREIC